MRYFAQKENADLIYISEKENAEFLWAIGDTVSTSLVKKLFEAGQALGERMNRKLLRDFRLYMLVGGMPQAVDEYIKTNNFRKVDAVKRDILSLYEDDFKKIDATGRLSVLFDAIPAQLNKNASRYQISSVLDSGWSDKMLELIAELKDSKTVLISYHTNDPNAGMANNKDLTKFKMFLCDTGLFVTLMFKDKDFTENIIGSQKPLWLRKYGHTVRTCCFIGSGNLCIRELFRNHALGWGCFLYLTDKRHAFLFQSLFKPEISFGKMLRLYTDFFR